MGQCAFGGNGGGNGGNARIRRLMNEDDGLDSERRTNVSGRERKATTRKKKTQTKLLLLGTGHSGKSTIFKQFQLVHLKGFSDAERRFYRTLMIDSTISTIRKLLQSANDLVFEGEMDDDDFFELMKSEENEELSERGRGHDADGSADDEQVSFTEFIKPSTPARGTNRSTQPPIREPHASDLSESSVGGGGGAAGGRYTDVSVRTGRGTDISDMSGVLGGRRTDISDVGSMRVYGSAASHRRPSKLKQRPLGEQDGGGISTVVSAEVAHLAEIVRDLPEGTMLYDRIPVSVRRLDPSDDVVEEEEEEEMQVSEMLKRVWNDSVIQQVYSMEEKMPTLEAPIAYYMEHIDRIAGEDFVPTEEDMLYSRKQTRKVQQLEFKAEGKSFQLIDVGGQRIERRNWINYFEDVDAVLYVVGLDGFNQVAIEDGKTNRMRESLQLFKDICESPDFAQTNMILFFNKEDIFREKIVHTPLSRCFRSYIGPQHDYDACIKYIIKRFTDTHARCVQRNVGLDQLAPTAYPYVTCATASDKMQVVITTCQAMFLRKGMAQCGIAAM
ncbi:Guanine nucleotide-binding protein alpha-16 subunit [Durusdinium trenchii]|uniref:Guanine nucleotide-binding protein alpha-16 subunit n=1 Tax=Durusdinium trenchii TaxID=1381693 RepID=A0ABP0HHE3_9DINO